MNNMGKIDMERSVKQLSSLKKKHELRQRAEREWRPPGKRLKKHHGRKHLHITIWIKFKLFRFLIIMSTLRGRSAAEYWQFWKYFCAKNVSTQPAHLCLIYRLSHAVTGSRTVCSAFYTLNSNGSGMEHINVFSRFPWRLLGGPLCFSRAAKCGRHVWFSFGWFLARIKKSKILQEWSFDLKFDLKFWHFEFAFLKLDLKIHRELGVLTWYSKALD